MDIRKAIGLTKNFLMEIERGGYIDDEVLDDMQDQEFVNPQGDLFPEIPSLEPAIPKGHERVGQIGNYVIVHKQNTRSSDLYFLLDKSKVIGWVGLIPTNSKDVDYPGMLIGIHNDLHGDGLQIAGVQVDRQHGGQGLSIKLYEWLLRNVCDYLVSDLTHTDGGEAIWRKLQNSRRFDVRVYDNSRNISRKRWAGKDWQQVYTQWHLIPWVTLAGKADQIIHGDENDD